MATQKAIVVTEVGGPLEFKDIDRPTLTNPRDILIKVLAVGLNPVDFKIKNGLKGSEKKGEPFAHRKVLGFDGAGVVERLGSEAHQFRVGDSVYWAGNIQRDGSFQQFQLVDERLVALKPKSLTFEQAASLPLTSITANGALRQRMRVEAGKRILITAGAGGVGSIATQLAHHWGLTVISSVSRPETKDWSKAHGADFTVDHSKGISESFTAQGLDHVDYCFSTFSDQHLTDVIKVIKPFGHYCGINGNMSDKEIPAIQSMFPKIISLHQFYMFGTAVHKVNEQSVGDLLAEVAGLVDQGALQHTMHDHYSWHDVHKAFEYLEGRTVIGKVVMTIDENKPVNGH